MDYNPAFVFFRPILQADEKRFLRKIANGYTLETFKKEPRNYEEVMVDFVYTSAKIEGNTYNRADTDSLLRMGRTAGGKLHSDALMLINLRDAFTSVLNIEPKKKLDFDYTCELHKTITSKLLPKRNQGIVRDSAVRIGASEYTPLSDGGRLRTELKFILDEAEKYNDPFEKSIYLHCNIAYLQAFMDGNKRAARMMQTASLASDNVLPLFFHEKFIGKYRDATLGYYETGEYKPYVEFFKENYEYALKLNIGSEKAEILLSQAETTANEQRALLENASLEQTLTATLKPYVEAKHAQIERIETRLTDVMERQQTKLQQTENNPPKPKWYASKKTKAASETAWRDKRNQQLARLHTLNKRKHDLGKIKQGTDARYPTVEELATRKMRRDHPELAASWDAMREAVRIKQQQEHKQREKQVQQQTQSQSQSLSHRLRP